MPKFLRTIAVRFGSREMESLARDTAFARRLVVLLIWTILTIPSLNARALAADSAATGARIEPSQVVAKARRLERAGQLRAAEQLLRPLRDSLTAKGVAADRPQLAGCLELLASIYRESGRYDEAQEAGLRYLAILEAMPRRDPVMAVKRQETGVLLAEIALAREDLRASVGNGQAGAAIPAGLRQSDPLWEPRAYALKARIEQRLGDAQATRQSWREVEAHVRAALEQAQSGPINNDWQEAAIGLLTQSLIALGRPQEAVDARERLLARQAANDPAAARNLAQIATCYAELQDDAGEQRSLEAAIALLEKHEKEKSSDTYAGPARPPGKCARAPRKE